MINDNILILIMTICFVAGMLVGFILGRKP